MHNLIETPLALLAGLLTIASPCILPVMPILLGSSVDRPSRVRPLFIIAGFILSFASFAMLLGARLLMGAAEGGVMPISHAMVASEVAPDSSAAARASCAG